MKTMKKILAVFLATILAFGVMSVSVFAEDGDSASGEAINFVDVTIELPEDGLYGSSFHSLGSEAYELVSLMWTDVEANEVIYSSVSESLVEEKPFEDGKVYTATITLYAAKGYVFDLGDLVVSVNGYAAEIKEINLAGKRLVATCDFECSSEDFDINDDGTSITFDQILGLLKTVLITFIRFIGSLLGIK